MDDLFAGLEAHYCPPLDPALVSAILLDYDLAVVDQLADAKRVLDELKEDAIVNEAIDFEPSGTGVGEQDAFADSRTDSHVGGSSSQSRATESTSLTNGVSSLDLEDTQVKLDLDRESQQEVTAFDHLDEDAKVRRLQGIFGEQISRYSIQHTLRKYNGKWNATVDDLLSQASFVHDEGVANGNVVVAKGIDGFTDEHLGHRGRKGKARKRQPPNLTVRRSSSLPGLDDVSNAGPKNTWKTAAEDIDFVARHTGMSTANVSSVYYAQNASKSQTVAAILRSLVEDQNKGTAEDPVFSPGTDELAREFPNIAIEYLQALVTITHPSMEAARELARSLTSKTENLDGGRIEIIPRFILPEDVDSDTSWNAVTAKTRSFTSSRSASLDVASSASRRDAYAQAQAKAYSKASAAYRKAKSDRLMGGAAAYYGQLGREYAALSSNAAAEAADSLAASQSTPSELDLHGVDVQNAVRIAQEKVESWWNSLGENRVNGRIGAEDRLTGYRIVVGLGRHSEGGKSKLGPAVTKMLKQEGWRVESSGAVITVRGPSIR